MEPTRYKQDAPPDREALKAWKQIMDIASKHALITFAYGGMAILQIPSEQRRTGHRQEVLQSELMNETKEMEAK